MNRIKDAKMFKNFSVYIFLCIFCSSLISIAISYILLYFDAFELTVPSIITRFTLSLFLCLLLGSLISSLVGGISYTYIQDISVALREIASGNYNYKLKVGDKLVFKDVAKSFNMMADTLASTEIMKEDFIANFSHEFRTPINSIHGYASLLKKVDLSDDEKKEYIETIIFESKRLFYLADNILFLSNLNCDKKVPFSHVYLLDEQFRKIILAFNKSWDEKNISLDLDMDKVSFEGPEDLIGHIFGNLFSNALKFTKSKITVSLHEVNDEVVIRVSDDGIGMDKDTISHVYDVFFQADPSKNNGSGLGLSIVGRIIDLCGYKMEIDSILGLGSTFTLRLPINK